MGAADGGAARSIAPDDPADVLRQWLTVGRWELPLLPETGTAVLVACRDDESGARQVARIVERDFALTAHVLRVANSAAFAPSEPIVSLTQGISHLGLSTVAEITIAVVLHGRVFTARRYRGLIAGVWPHSAVAGGWAREIARQMQRNVEGAFLCGLLHDLGRPVALHGLIELERSAGLALDEATMRRVMDELHPEVGATLVRRWSLPEWMADAAGFHHDPESAVTHRQEVMMTALASRLAHWALERAAEDTARVRALPMLPALGLQPGNLDALLAARERVLEAVEWFV